jgi:3-oxoadipate enol-lactonase
MGFADVGGARIHYEISGPAEAPVLIFSNSLGTNLSMWDAQVAAIGSTMRVVRYDTRGHGKSSATPGPYTIEQLGRDVIGLADALKIERFSFCGLSMGGSTGMWLGIHQGERLNKLTLCSTGAKIGTAETWAARIAGVRKNGMKMISSVVVERWFTPQFREEHPKIVERTRQMIEHTNPDGYIACCEAIRDADFRHDVAAIKRPTLVISGTHDPATPPKDGQFLAERIAGARYVELDASHLSNIERERQFTTEVSNFPAA